MSGETEKFSENNSMHTAAEASKTFAALEVRFGKILLLGWKCHLSPQHPYMQRVWNVWVKCFIPDPTLGSCFSPDFTSEKPCQMMTSPQRWSRPLLQAI